MGTQDFRSLVSGDIFSRLSPTFLEHTVNTLFTYCCGAGKDLVANILPTCGQGAAVNVPLPLVGLGFSSVPLCLACSRVTFCVVL